jgi:HK97 family phage major capsid protein
MATYAELIQQYENKRRDAERRAADAGKMAQSYLKAIESAGMENLTADQERRCEDLLAKARTAKDEIRQADGAIKALREAQAEDERADELSRQVHDTPAASRKPGDSVTHVTPRPGTDGAMLYGAPVASDGPLWRYSDTGRPAALERGQRLDDHEVAREYADRQAEHDRIIVGTHGGLAQQIRALTTSGASAIVPTEWSFPIIDKVRNAAVVYKAGAVSVPMPAKIIQIGRLSTDPTAAFKTEGSAITASDPAFDYIQLTATTLSALTVASLEFLQDAPNADSVVSDAIAKVMALELDKAAMFGQLGATGTNDEGAAYGLASPYPMGILKNLLTNASSNVLGFATNGTAQTAATPWNEMLSLYYTMPRANEQTNAIVSNVALQQQYASMYDTLNNTIRMPVVLANTPWLATNSIPSYTRGTMASRATDVFAGDFSQVLIGERMQLEVRVLTERYAEAGQVGILAYWRGDVQVARPKALACYRALQGAL